MNKKILAVIKREYFTRVRTKGFIIGTILFPLILVFLFGGIFIFAKIFQPSTRHYTVLDQTGRIYDEIVKILEESALSISYRSVKIKFSKLGSLAAVYGMADLIINERIKFI